MLELDEKDIKAVASSRFHRKWRWFMIGILAAALVTIFSILFSVRELWTIWLVASLLLVVWIGGGILTIVGEARARKRLVGEWKEGK